MIEPGKLTLEILVSSPYLYLVVLYVIPLLLGGLTAYFADRAADEKLKQESRAIDLLADTTKIYEFENIRDPIAWGIFAVIVVVYPIAATLDSIGDFTTVWSASILTGIASRSILMKLVTSFITKVTQKQ